MLNKNKKIIIMGPCSLENKEQMQKIMELACELDIIYIRSQVYKPRTNPNSFQGLAQEGIEILKDLKSHPKFKELKLVCEVCSPNHFDSVQDIASIIQIGARNMQNFELLKYVAKNFSDQDYVLLKRGFANTVDEWLSAAQYLIEGGIAKDKILLCERGSRSATSPTGVTLDFNCALAAQKNGFKIIIDPSHGSKESDFVTPLAKGAMAMGFDGLMVESHPTPQESVSDKEQAIGLEETKNLFKNLF